MKLFCENQGPFHVSSLDTWEEETFPSGTTLQPNGFYTFFKGVKSTSSFLRKGMKSFAPSWCSCYKGQLKGGK